MIRRLKADDRGFWNPRNNKPLRHCRCGIASGLSNQGESLDLQAGLATVFSKVKPSLCSPAADEIRGVDGQINPVLFSMSSPLEL
jgi:hypothetical protein